MSSPGVKTPVLFGLRYVERLQIPLQEQPDAMRMSWPGDPRDTGRPDLAGTNDALTMRMSWPGDPRDTGRPDLA